MLNRAIFNRAPLYPAPFAPLPLGAIAPEGWLKDELNLMRDGLTGTLAEFWPDVRDSAWLGGSGDDWERAPYYFDGLVPLAWTLGDEKLIALCQRFVEQCVASARPDGFFGPDTRLDWWPRMVAAKALMQYYSATADQRIPELLYNYARLQYRALDDRPLSQWACARGGDNMLMVAWLYNITGKKFLLSLLTKLREQTLDWTGHFATFTHTQSMARLLPWSELVSKRAGEEGGLTGLNKPYYSTQYHLSHVVNVAMGLKTPGVINMFKSGIKEADGFKTGYEKLMKHHGVAAGLFTGDEHLSGDSPTQGSELCAVVELMYSIEALYACGEERAMPGDVLEKMAFNALPAAITPDGRGHQYDQQVNQVKVSNEPRGWYNNGPEANVFGLEPHFGCCTANMHQGFPKYCAHLWYAARDEGFAAISYAPCRVRFVSGDVPVQIAVDTAYPFEQEIRISVKTASKKRFPLLLRIPEWAEGARVNFPDGEVLPCAKGEFFRLEREWLADSFTLTLPMTPRTRRLGRHTATVELGPLTMALRPEEKWAKLNEHPYSPDWAVSAASPWNWALDEDAPLDFELTPSAAAAFKHGDAAKVRARAVRLPEWGMRGASCAPAPIDPIVDGAREEITLTPYGCSSLRIAQFPVARSTKDKGEN